MELSHYIFALFIFFLTALIIVLYKKLKGTDTKIEKSYYEKEQKLFKLYQSMEEMIEEAQEFIEEAKGDIQEDKKNINSMLEKADVLFRETKLERMPRQQQAKQATEREDEREVKQKVRDYIDFDSLSRNEQVKYLSGEGKNIEYISKELGMSQGEVALIIGLNR